MSFNNGQHIAANDGSISVKYSTMDLLGDEFVVELRARDRTGQSVGGLIQERHIQVLQIPHSSREVVASINVYNRSGMSNT